MIELACDESGYEGERLVGGVTDVFAHGSTRITDAGAERCVQELRRRIRSPALEYKANHLLRQKNRGALEWLLDPEGPLHGIARVHLVDKELFAARRLGELMEGGPPPRAALGSFDALMRVKQATDLPAAEQVLRAALDGAALDGAGLDGAALDGAALDGAGLDGAAARAAALRAGFLADPSGVPSLDPLVPAIRATLASWSPDGEPVSIVHDRQTTLTASRVALIGPPLAGLRFADSRTDARVQVADFLAGVATRIASDALAGRPDGVLIELLRPFVDARSVWADGTFART